VPISLALVGVERRKREVEIALRTDRVAGALLSGIERSKIRTAVRRKS
jgi:hypothetical protein